MKEDFENVRNKELFDTACKAISEGLEIIKKIEKERSYLPTYFEFPKMDSFNSDLPSFSKFFLLEKGPIEYKKLLIPSDDNSIQWPDSWLKFKKLALNNERYASYFQIRKEDINPKDPFRSERFFEWNQNYYTLYRLANQVDRYIHLTKTKEFKKELYKPIYISFEKSIYEEELFFDVWIPIVCQKFSFDEVQLTSEALIIKMDENLQLARNKTEFKTVSMHETVSGASTHALVLKNWSVKNIDCDKRREPFYDINAFSEIIKKVDLYLASIRVVTGLEMGYCQLIAVPDGWADNWIAYLPSIYINTVRKYPDKLEKFGWLTDSSPITKEEIKKVGPLSEAFNKLENNRLKVAIRRLNTAFLRNNEADTILDITIALEALLVGNSHSEITHKLAMRLSALSAIEKHPKYNATKLFELLKQVYKYRSAVVHGSKDADKKKQIKVHDSQVIPAVEIGIDLLRYTIRTLSLNPKYFEPKKLDSLLISR